ncbi:hypothetical protein [Aurantibacillus circumpalustris]|uniref:hypothetical protein n=1 Tax=Aurantibacillus circumpalustris TaxID=3036359 RepID=UPI00295AE849|nr:hypothetical protein [Aurantibacillus circumpalustris]
MARALSVSELYAKKRKLLAFEGEWEKHLGQPEPFKTWLIWGDSSNGKTTYVLKLAKYLSQFGKVLYNSMEEGDSESMKKAFKRVGMEDVRRRVMLLDNEPMNELEERLKKKKAPKIVIIDTVQYSEMTFSQYKHLKETLPNVLWIYVSHEDGKLPDGKVAKRIRRDAMIKIRVVGFKAFPTSRYGGTEPYIVWQEGADKYHGSEF